MAGTLVADTLQDGAGNSTAMDNAIYGSAKAWVNYNGSAGSAAIRASYNVSSVTYTSAGNYTINFTNAFSDTNYATVFGNNGYAGYGSPAYPSWVSVGTKATSSQQIYTGSPISGGNCAWSASVVTELSVSCFR